MTALLHPNVTSPDALNINDSDFLAWRFDSVSNADGPLSAALAQFPSDAVALVVLNADLTSEQVPRLVEWLEGADIPLTIVVARSVRKDAAKAITAAAHGVLLFSDADVVAMGEQRAGGPEGVSQFFVVAD